MKETAGEAERKTKPGLFILKNFDKADHTNREKGGEPEKKKGETRKMAKTGGIGPFRIFGRIIFYGGWGGGGTGGQDGQMGIGHEQRREKPWGRWRRTKTTRSPY